MFSLFKKKEAEETDFTNSELQQKYIHSHLESFRQAREKLLNVDKQIGAATVAETLLYLTGFIGKTTTLAISIGIYLYASQYILRKDYALKHDENLQKLLEIYEWCISGHVKNLAQNATFLQLLATIAPLVDLEELKIPRLHIKSRENLSEEFLDILSREPHRIHFIMPQDPLPFIQKNQEPDDKQKLPLGSGIFNISKNLIDNRIIRLFPQFTAEANRAFYGSNLKLKQE